MVDSTAKQIKGSEEVSISYCAVYGPYPFDGKARAGSGCVYGQPLFLNPADLDYRLGPGSPCSGKASDGKDIGCRYTPEMIAIIKEARDFALWASSGFERIDTAAQ